MKRIKIKMLSLILASAVSIVCGTAFAAESPSEAADTATSEEIEYVTASECTSGGYETAVEDVNLNKASAVLGDVKINYLPKSDKIYVAIDNSYACKIEIRVNGKIYKTIDRHEYVTEDYTAPYVSQSVYIDDLLLGGTYKIEVIPYSHTSTGCEAGTPVSETVTVPGVNISTVRFNFTPRFSTYDNGYGSPWVSLGWTCDTNVITCPPVELQRKEGKGTWKNIKVPSGAWTYTDRSLTPNKSYVYRIRIQAISNKWCSVAAGSWFTFNRIGESDTIQNVKIDMADVSLLANYGAKGVELSMSCNDGCISGYEIYRSTKRTKNYKKIATVAENYYTDKKVKNGTYYYKVRAYWYNTVTGKKYYGVFSEPVGVKCIMGSVNAQVKQTGKNQATVSWDKVAGAKKYEVYYKSGMPGDAYKLYKRTTKTSCKISKLLNNTEYYFQVKAIKNGTYYDSNTMNCHIGFTTPNNLRVVKTNVKHGENSNLIIKSTLKWDPLYGAKCIRIVAVTYGHYENGSYIPEKEEVLKTLKGTATSYVLTNVNTPYSKGYNKIKVVAVNGKNEEYSTIYPDEFNRINAVSAITVKRKDETGATVSWKAVEGATNYNVYRQSPYGEACYLGSTSATFFEDNNLTKGVNYAYYVRTETGYYIYDRIEHRKTVIYNNKLGATKIKSVKNSAAKKATVTWNSVAGSEKYVVYRATSKKGRWKKIATTAKTSFTDKKLKKGKTYYYKVKATCRNAAGLTVTSAFSSVKAVKIKK